MDFKDFGETGDFKEPFGAVQCSAMQCNVL